MQPIPLFLESISAGFPSPANDYIEDSIDLNRQLIKHPAATFFVRVQGDSMSDVGILPGDTLIVDRAVAAKDGTIIVALLNGEFTVKRLKKWGEIPYLVPENSRYSPIKIDPESDFQVWGVVTYVIHKTH